MLLQLLVATFSVLAAALLGLWRVLTVLRQTHAPQSAPPPRPPGSTASIAIFLGSGGHTAEMMRLLASLPLATRYTHRTYLIAAGDNLSQAKALALEQTIGAGTFRLIQIPRARYVHQPYLTSPLTTLHSLVFCLWHVTLAPIFLRPAPRRTRAFADVILLNGPGSCVPIAAAAFLPRASHYPLLGLPAAKLIYVESLARTQRLSLSGLLVRPLVDRFFVQWEGLRDKLKTQGKTSRRPEWLLAEVECEGWLV